MNQEALVSVLMPVFKADTGQLKIAVDSVLQQTYKNIELLVLFEGEGSDPCYTMLRGIDDKRLIIVSIPLKSGLPKSLNIGIEQSKGKYIARMDADDYSLPDRFEHQINFMESHPEIDVVGGICRYMNSRTLSFSTMISPEKRAARMLFNNAGVAHPTVVMKKEFLNKNNIKYNESIKGSEDYHLWIDFVLTGGKIDSIDKIVLLYRIHERQASKILEKEMVDWDDMGREKIINRIGIFSDEEKEAIYQFCNSNNHDISIESTVTILEKLAQLGSECLMFKAGVFPKEVCYEWIQKALREFKSSNGWNMLKFSVLRRLWVKGEMSYLINEYYRKVKGKVITNIGFRRRNYT